MNTDTTETVATAADRQPDAGRRDYLAELAYGPRRETPVWKRIAPDLSGGYVEVHLALDCGNPDYTFEDVTSS